MNRKLKNYLQFRKRKITNYIIVKLYKINETFNKKIKQKSKTKAIR